MLTGPSLGEQIPPPYLGIRYAVSAEVTIGLASYMQLTAQSLVVPFTFISFKDFYYKAPEGYRFPGIFGRARVFSLRTALRVTLQLHLL
jgi:hypothetical protein